MDRRLPRFCKNGISHFDPSDQLAPCEGSNLDLFAYQYLFKKSPLSPSLENHKHPIDSHCKNSDSLILSCHTWKIPKRCTNQIYKQWKSNFDTSWEYFICDNSEISCQNFYNGVLMIFQCWCLLSFKRVHLSVYLKSWKMFQILPPCGISLTLTVLMCGLVPSCVELLAVLSTENLTELVLIIKHYLEMIAKQIYLLWTDQNHTMHFLGLWH